MKKNLSVLLAGATESGLFSCNNRSGEASRNTETDSTATYIRAGLWPVAYTISTEIRHLKSVAFFIESPRGKFYKFLSTEPLKSRHGFEELVKTGNNYTGVTFKLKEDSEGDNKITVVGNYNENNLTEALKSAKCMDDILALKVRTAIGEYPLLMFDHKIIEISSEL